MQVASARISGFECSLGALMLLCAKVRDLALPPSNNGMQQMRDHIEFHARLAAGCDSSAPLMQGVIHLLAIGW